MTRAVIGAGGWSARLGGPIDSDGHEAFSVPQTLYSPDSGPGIWV